MQHSLFRRRLAVRACFDVLLERRIVPTSLPITTNDASASLLRTQTFVSIDFI
jgi:hypothetical protein